MNQDYWLLIKMVNFSLQIRYVKTSTVTQDLEVISNTVSAVYIAF